MKFDKTPGWLDWYAGPSKPQFKLPPGSVQARGDAGVAGYFGPCPPQGDAPHRYIFTIFAVKTDKLDINADTSGAVVGFNLHFNTIDKATVTYTYVR